MVTVISSGWIDVSAPLRSGMVHWPGDAEVSIERTQSIEKGAGANISRLSMSAHTGTHVDAPLHYIRGGKSIDEAPVEALVGPARTIQVRDERLITPEELQEHNIRAGERILLRTRNSLRDWPSAPFTADFVHLTPEAATFLAARRVLAVGIDYLSAGGTGEDGNEVHRTLLGAGIWIIEGLDLSHAGAGEYELICLPLRIEHGDGAPARVLLRSVPVRA